MEIVILENIQREKLNPIEETEAYKRFMNEFFYTQEELSKILRKRYIHITNILRLLLREKKLTFGYAWIIDSENASVFVKHIVE